MLGFGVFGTSLQLAILVSRQYSTMTCPAIWPQRWCRQATFISRRGAGPLGLLRPGIYFQDHPKQKTEPVSQILKYERDHAMLIFLRNPVTFARIYLEGVIRAIFDPLSAEFLRIPQCRSCVSWRAMVYAPPERDEQLLF
jgi:hypothetical protein